MRAIILAGGKGTRLKPYTATLPKPLVPVGDKAILEIVIKQLKKFGFDNITIAVNHMADLIMAYFGDGSKWGVDIDYSIEDTPLSTIGPLTLIDDLPENFLVMNGDILTDLNYEHLFTKHVESKNLITVSTYKRTAKIDFGVLDVESNSNIIGFREKPEYSFEVSMGIYIINKRLVEGLEKNKPYGFDNLMIYGIKNKIPMGRYLFNGYWLDIGRPDDFETANEIISELNF